MVRLAAGKFTRLVLAYFGACPAPQFSKHVIDFTIGKTQFILDGKHVGLFKVLVDRFSKHLLIVKQQAIKLSEGFPSWLSGVSYDPPGSNSRWD